jgi:hypothetical protein
MGCQLQAETVLIVDLLVAPAAGPVKFDDNRFVIFDSYLIDPVFVAVESQGPAIAAKSPAFDSVHDEARGEGLKGLAVVGRHGKHFLQKRAFVGAGVTIPLIPAEGPMGSGMWSAIENALFPGRMW